jgi:hypothetical protein
MAPFHFGQMAVKTGTFGTEAALDGVRKVSVKIERGMAVDRYYAGAAGLKAEPISNDQVKITGASRWTTSTRRWTTCTPATVRPAWSGSSWARPSRRPSRRRSASPCPRSRFDDAPPSVEGFDVIKPTYNFTALYDGTNPVKIEYISTDITL